MESGCRDAVEPRQIGGCLILDRNVEYISILLAINPMTFSKIEI